jgi:glycerophosphoryl diester phosphodiesterase
MTDYVKRARELGIPLLIELKAVNPDFTDPGGDMLRQLAAAHGISGNMFHSLDEAAVKRMIQLRPDVQIGLTLGLRVGALPTLKVDFYTVDQSSVTPQLIKAAHAEGRRVYSWTVNDDLTMRILLREGLDGLITDKPLRARAFTSRIDGGQSTTVDAVHDLLTESLTW